jgi:DNA-binding NtrC family response regulator
VRTRKNPPDPGVLEIYQQFINESVGHFGRPNHIFASPKPKEVRGLDMRNESMITMQTEHLPPHAQLPRDPNLLNTKLANISTLVSSLNAAVEDLEALDLTKMDEQFDFYHEVERFEIKLIKSALIITGGSQIKAARLLKLNATTLNAKIKTFKLATK